MQYGLEMFCSSRKGAHAAVALRHSRDLSPTWPIQCFSIPQSDYAKHLCNGRRRLDGCGFIAGCRVFDLAHHRGKTPQPPHERRTPPARLKRLNPGCGPHPGTSCPGTEKVVSCSWTVLLFSRIQLLQNAAQRFKARNGCTRFLRLPQRFKEKILQLKGQSLFEIEQC
jgi:hypothetical protein